MKKRQKLILILYTLAVFLLSFVYVPYARYYPGGVKTSAGHHLRFTELWGIIPWEREIWGRVAIDAHLIFTELIAVTAIATAAFLLLKRE